MMVRASFNKWRQNGRSQGMLSELEGCLACTECVYTNDHSPIGKFCPRRLNDGFPRRLGFLANLGYGYSPLILYAKRSLGG